jgi:hypothetical protein
MTKYNFAQGGDIHYNEGMALYPQNAFVGGAANTAYGSSKTILKPAHHWEGGSYAAVRHMSFNDEQHMIGLRDASAKLVAADSFLTHILPGMSIFTGFHYVIHTPLVGATFSVKLASNGLVLGTINAAVKGDGYFAPPAPVYISSAANDAIEVTLDAWPVAAAAPVAADDCDVFGPCPVYNDFCWTTTLFYQHFRAEAYCQSTCYD